LVINMTTAVQQRSTERHARLSLLMTRFRALPSLLPTGFAMLAVALLFVGARTTDLSAMGGLGLAGVLSLPGWLAIAFAVAACSTEISRQRVRHAHLASLTAVLIICTVGLPSVVEPTARLPVAWLHYGFVESIINSGQRPQGIDSRFGWPGFFAEWAAISSAAGGYPLDEVLHWFPPVVVTIWAVGVFAIARVLLSGARAPWIAMWLFLGTNWIDQDYFSPQATGMVLMLGVFAAVLGPLATRLQRDHISGVRRAVAPVARPDLPPRKVLILFGLLTICTSALVFEHPLSPFALLFALLVLAVAGRFWGKQLIILFVVIEITWVVLGAQELWYGQLKMATGDLGQLGSTINAGLVDRIVGDTGQLVVKVARIGVAAGLWILAILGAWLRWRRSRELVVIGLAASPTFLAGLQGYDGEILIRVMLFALPFLAVLGFEALRAGVQSIEGSWPSRRRFIRGLLTLGMLVLFLSLVVLRGGNDAYVSVRPQDLALTRQVLASAPPNATVLGMTWSGPLGVTRITDVTHTYGTTGCTSLADMRCVDALDPDIIIVLPTMEAEGVVLNGRPPGWTQAMTDRLVMSNRYRISLRSDGSTVLVRAQPQ
jgi:hypothetical protein